MHSKKSRSAKPSELEAAKAFFRLHRAQSVRIVWKNPNHDWQYFRVLGVRGGRMKLRGENDPMLKAKHAGDEFWCAISGVREYEAIGQN